MNRQTESDTSSLETRVSEDILGVEEEREDDALVIDKPFDPDRIKVTTEKKTIDLIVRRIGHREVDLAPEFQRRARLWHPHRKSQLIESLLLRIPLPVFYVAANKQDDWTVVDGLQRITTIYDFVSDAFPLSGLEYLKPLEGLYFKGLDRALKRRIEETELVINVIQPGTPEEVMINIFKRINTGGIPLNGQEIRNALHKGPVRDLLRELANSEEFKTATDNRVRDERMDGQELALRFLAFHMSNWSDYRVNNLDAFLSEAMRKINAMSGDEINGLSLEFKRAMTAAFRIFDTAAFRKPREKGRSPVSKPLFEAWSVNLSKLNQENIETLVGKRKELAAGLLDMIENDSEFAVSISYSTGVPRRVQKRFSSIESLIKKYI